MGKGFEQQMKLGVKPIAETLIRLKSRDDIPALIQSLLLIYTTPEYNEKIFSILEEATVLKGKKAIGRPGIDYDPLDELFFSHSDLRQLLGIENNADFIRIITLILGVIVSWTIFVY